MKRIRDAQTIIGMLEGGELAESLYDDIKETLGKLQQLSEKVGRKTKVKGKVTLSLEFEVSEGSVSVLAGIDTKVPRAPRSSSFYWLTGEGELSLEHPQQTDMFGGPREAGGRRAADN